MERRHSCVAGVWPITNIDEDTMSNALRGFASMESKQQRALASKGGRAAHAKGTAHEWSSDEAREAGRKGGLASANRRRSRNGKRNGRAA
jgi:hypothetical protein